MSKPKRTKDEQAAMDVYDDLFVLGYIERLVIDYGVIGGVDREGRLIAYRELRGAGNYFIIFRQRVDVINT